MERMGLGPVLQSSFSLHSVAEGSEIISEAEEIQEVQNLQEAGAAALEVQAYDEALQAYDEALEIDRNNAVSLCGRANAYLQMGKYVFAQLDAEKAISINSKDPNAHGLHARALGGLGYDRESVVAAIRALDLSLSQGDPIDELVTHIVSMAARYCKMSAQLQDRLTEMDPYRQLCETGACMFHSRRYDLCIKLLNVTQKLDTEHPSVSMKVLFTLGNAYGALKHYDLAIAVHQDCLKVAKSDGDVPYQTKALVSMASLYLDTGDTYQGLIYYEKLISLQTQLMAEDPDGRLPEYWSKDLQCALHLNLSIAYKSVGNLEHALKHANFYVELVEGIDLEQKNAEAISHQNLGALYEIMGEYTKALDHFKLFLDISKAGGDKKATAQAYGCLGGAYAQLNNAQLAKTYHEQHINLASKLQDQEQVVCGYEQFGDSLIVLEEYSDAGEKFMDMFKACVRTDLQMQARALCKLAKAYKAQKRHQYSIYYFEQALAIAEDFKFWDIVKTCQLNLACLMQYSSQISELDQSKRYFEALIPELEATLERYREEGAFVSPEIKEQLQECYSGIQNVSVKLGAENECLRYAELSRHSHVNHTAKDGQSVGSKVWTLQKIKRVVTERNVTVLYYTVLPSSYLLWVLQPGVGVVRFYSGRSKTTEQTIDEQIRELMSKIKQGNDIQKWLFQCENRSLPYRDAAVQQQRLKNKSLSKHSDINTSDSDVQSDNDDIQPQKRLFNLLLAAVYDILLALDAQSPVVIIPDGSLVDCPFGIIRDWDGQLFGERVHITYMSSLAMMEQVTCNELKQLQLADATNFERAQSRLGGVATALHSHELCESFYTPRENDTPNRNLQDLNPKQTSNPRLVTALKSSENLEAEPPAENQNLLRTKFTLGSPRLAKSPVPTPPVTRRSRPPGQATSLARMLAVHSVSTLTSHTSTDTDITSSSFMVTDYRQVCDPHHCVVIGSPVFPKRAMLHGEAWTPPSQMSAAQSECVQVAQHMDVAPIVGQDATKARFLEELKKATVIHIATLGCLREGYLAFTPDPDPHGTGPPGEHSYIVTAEDILSTSVVAKLVVLSGCWRAVDTTTSLSGYPLAAAFAQAGAQCVLTLLWPVPNPALDMFYHRLYTTLATQTTVAAAVTHAANTLRDDNRFSHVVYWSPFILIGQDVTLDLTQIKHAMLGQQLNRVEAVVEQMGKSLNPALPASVPNKEHNLAEIQTCISQLLSQHSTQPTVIPSLTDLVEGSLRRLQEPETNAEPSRLSDAMRDSEGAMHLLGLVGYHWLPGGAHGTEPYVMYPHWDKDQLLVPTYDALGALIEVLRHGDCARAIQELLPTSQDSISQLVDLLAVTRHAADVQLKVTDTSIRPLWMETRTHTLLSALGYHQIGSLLNYANIPANRKLLGSCLRLLICVSAHKSPVFLQKLDMSLLGSHVENKDSDSCNKNVKLPSLNPVMLPKNQVKMSTPWLSSAEKSEEMKEKMKLAKSKYHLSEEYKKHMMKANAWNHMSLKAQANEALKKVGKPKVVTAKVKVMGGGTASQDRTPVNKSVRPSLAQTVQRRETTKWVLQQRHDNVAMHRNNQVKKLYLPYITNV